MGSLHLDGTYKTVQIISQHYLVGGFNPSEKYYIVSWDDDSHIIMEHKKMFQTTNQL